MPDAGGVWGEIYYRVYRVHQRNRKRKKRLIQIISRFRESTAAMPDATVVLKASGDIEWINRAASRLLGLQTPQDIGKRIGFFIRHPKFQQYWEDKDFSKPVEIPSRTDENVFLSLTMVPYGKKQRLLIARDVTQLRKLEQIRRDFVANASHELRTPLTVIAGLVETLDERTVSETDHERAITLMSQQTMRMQKIIEDLMLLTQLETDRPLRYEPVAVANLVNNLVEEAKALSSNHHRFHVDVDEKLWVVGDEKELCSAFMNLLSNAVRYTPENGNILVRWQRSRDDAMFEVGDSGIGIASQHLSRLTERFYRVDIGRSRGTGGTGLGLAIVKHVMDRYDGKLNINSELGKGSNFRCFFPKKCIHEAQKTHLTSAPLS